QADGTYKVDPEVHRREANRLADLHRSFAPTRVDEYGQDNDLRPTEADFANVGDENDEIFGLADGDPTNAHRPVAPPKYDPATGELIRPITIKDDRPAADPSTIPVAKAVIQYAGPEVGDGFPAYRIIPEMFKFGNLTV